MDQIFKRIAKTLSVYLCYMIYDHNIYCDYLRMQVISLKALFNKIKLSLIRRLPLYQTVLCQFSCPPVLTEVSEDSLHSPSRHSHGVCHTCQCCKENTFRHT